MKIKIRRRTFGTQIEVDRIEAAILTSLPEEQRERDYFKIAASNAAVLGVHTIPGTVELDSEEANIEEYKSFLEIVETLKVDDPIMLWQAYCSVDEAEIIPLWTDAYKQAHQPLAPKHQRHSKHLSKAEREALQDPDSPLPEPAGSGK